MQISTKQFRPFDVIAPVELLVDTVRRVGRAAHGEKEDVLPGRLLEG